MFSPFRLMVDETVKPFQDPTRYVDIRPELNSRFPFLAVLKIYDSRYINLNHRLPPPYNILGPSKMNFKSKSAEKLGWF